MSKTIVYNVQVNDSDKAFSEITKLKAANDELKKANKDLNEEVKRTGDSTGKAATQMTKNSVAIKENNTQIRLLTDGLTTNTTAARGTRRELTQLRRAMQESAAAGDVTSNSYRQMRDRASELQDQINRVSTEIKVFADDAIVINSVVDATQGLASGMQLVQSATALMGVENEKLMEVLVRLQALQGVVNGLQGVSNVLQKESRILLLAKIGAQKAATAAQWLWNAALTANPIGLLIAGIAALAGGFTLLSRRLKKNKKDLDDNAESVDNLGESLNKIDSDKTITKVSDSLSELSNRDIDVNISGLSRVIKLQLEAYKRELAYKNNLISLTVDQNQKEILINQTFQLRKKIIEEELNLAKQLEEEAANRSINNLDDVKLYTAWLDTIEALKVAEEEYTRKINLLRLERQNITESEIEANKKLTEEKIQNGVDEANQLAEQTADNLKREELAAAQLAVIKNKSYQTELDLLNLQLRNELTQEDLTNTEKLLIEEEYLIQKKELFDRYAELESSVYDTYMLNKREQEKDDFQKRLEMYTKWLADKEINQKQFNELEKELEADKTKFYREQALARANASLNETRTLLANLEQLGEGNERWVKFAKKAAIAEAAASMAVGLANTLKIGFPANIPMLIGFAAQAANLALQIKKLKEPTAPKFAQGGIIGGKPHSQGGTTFQGTDGSVFEAERGEYLAIVNKKDANRAAMLDSINQTNGKPFNTGIKFARGGIVVPKPVQNFGNDVDEIIRKTIREVARIPVVVTERDITNTQEKVRKLRVNGDL